MNPVALPLLVALALRIVWAVFTAGAGPLFFASGDQYSYWFIGKSIADGHGYALPTSFGSVRGEATAYYPFGFPLILAGLYWLTNHTPLPDGEVWITTGYQVVVGTLGVWLVHLVASAVANARVALVAAWITALFPNLVYGVATFSLELTFIALTFAALAIAVRHDWASGVLPSRQRLIAFGVAFAAAMAVRPFALPMLAGLVLAGRRAGSSWRAAVRTAVAPLAAVAVVLVPWTVRNAIELDAFVPMSTNLGDTLCMDRTDDANGQFRFAGDDGCADPDTPEVERNRTNAWRAVVFMASNPLKEAHLVAMRAYRMMEADHTGLDEVEANGSVTFSSGTGGKVLEEIADWWFYAVAALAVGATWRERRRLWNTGPRVIVFTTAIGLLLIPLGLWGNPRFHVPVLPFMAIAAAGALVGVADRVRSRARA